MTLSANISSLAIRIATEFKTERTVTAGIRADLSALESVVAGMSGDGAAINDGTVSTSSVWSSSKTDSSIKSAVAALVDSAPEALDTLKELATALQDEQGATATILDKLAQVGATDTNYVSQFESALA